ncbi:MAG TPA: hypothetical protein VMV92_41100 [Streptosporangiaceae bacterium]|nr:hypothetical protein [Streptosporangiaceae bacterium]
MTDQDTGWIPGLVERLRVKPGSTVRLAKDFDPGARFGVRKKEQGQNLLRRGVELLAEYQQRLAAQDTYAVLVVLQALDAAGKDSTIRHVLSGVNPQGVKVSSFKAPSAEDLGHDYLWRHACRLPARGEIGIFNRSHYEEVLVVRVHPGYIDGERLPPENNERLPPENKGRGIWERRYREINDWEHYLVDNGIRVVKMFLNVSKEEQLPASSGGSTSRRRTGSSAWHHGLQRPCLRRSIVFGHCAALSSVTVPSEVTIRSPNSAVSTARRAASDASGVTCP